jgi:hypothetical protein
MAAATQPPSAGRPPAGFAREAFAREAFAGEEHAGLTRFTIVFGPLIATRRIPVAQARRILLTQNLDFQANSGRQKQANATTIHSGDYCMQ